MESVNGNPSGINLFQQVSNQGQANQVSATSAQSQTPTTNTTSTSDTVTISQQAQDLLAAENNPQPPASENATLRSSGAENGVGPK